MGGVSGGDKVGRVYIDVIFAVLFRSGCGDGIVVVSVEEDDGVFEGGGEVEVGVGIFFIGRFFIKVIDDDFVGIGSFGRVGRFYRCRE